MPQDPARAAAGSSPQLARDPQDAVTLPLPADFAARASTARALAPTPSPAPATPSPSPSLSQIDPSELKKVCTTCQNRYPEDFLVCPRDATPLHLEGQEGDPLVGKVLGDAYQILRVVGEGGMGRVYEARHLRLKDRRFAVKVLHPEMARDAEIVARFQREAESASSISHPNVVDVFDVHRTPDGIPYLVGEFLEGEEVGDRLERQGQIDIPNAVHITRQVCRALSAAHARGIVHRDMKPENVFLVNRDDGVHVKVIDFGISKEAGPSNLTKTGVVMGTPSYMAPEQARGDKVDPRADVYAVGAMLYHMVTGKKPFDSEDATSTLTLVITEEATRPRALNDAIPEGLEVVIQRAMAKDVRERYASMSELDAALAPWDVAPSGLSLPVIDKGAPSASGAAIKARPNFDANAKTMIAGGGTSAVGDEVRVARPTIVLAMLGLAVWFVVGVVTAIGGFVRMRRDGELTFAETLMMLIGAVATGITPLILATVRIRKNVWQSSPKSMDLAADLRRMVLGAFTSLGVLALAVRFTATIIARNGAVLTAGDWDVELFGASALVTLIAWAYGPIVRWFRRRRAAR
jgi:serine/threonine-protein kinase